MNSFKSQNLAAIAVSEDGRSMTLSFDDNNQQVLNIEIPTIEMHPIIQKIVGALAAAEAKSNLSKQGVRALMSPSRTAVGPTSDGQDLILIFQMQSGLEYSFALPSNEALQFGQKIVVDAQKNIKSRPFTAH